MMVRILEIVDLVSRIHDMVRKVAPVSKKCWEIPSVALAIGPRKERNQISVSDAGGLAQVGAGALREADVVGKLS